MAYRISLRMRAYDRRHLAAAERVVALAADATASASGPAAPAPAVTLPAASALDAASLMARRLQPEGLPAAAAFIRDGPPAAAAPKWGNVNTSAAADNEQEDTSVVAAAAAEDADLPSLSAAPPSSGDGAAAADAARPPQDLPEAVLSRFNAGLLSAQEVEGEPLGATQEAGVDALATGRVKPAAALPDSKKLIVVNRSPHIDKKSREQFWMHGVHAAMNLDASSLSSVQWFLYLLKTAELPGVEMTVNVQDRAK